MSLNKKQLMLINKYANMHKESMEKFLKKKLEFNEEFVLLLEKEIEMMRITKNEDFFKLRVIGICLGKCILNVVDGEWYLDEESNSYRIRYSIPGKSGVAKVSPLSKVLKQFDNGSIDSIRGIYSLLITFI